MLFLDTETYSECNLSSAGVYRYAQDPSTELLMVQWAIDEGEPQVADLTVPESLNAFVKAFLDPNQTLVAHNSTFDRNMLQHRLGLAAPIERWCDTMVLAYIHSLPGSLAALGAVLGLPQDAQKDKRGAQLIQLFCKPFRGLRRDRNSHPAEWAEFKGYARQDVVALRAIFRKLPKWNWPVERELWWLDQKINDRGFAVDVDLAEKAQALASAERRELALRTKIATDGAVEATSQGDRLLNYLMLEYGVALPDLRADTVRRRLENQNLPDGLRQLLEIRASASRTSTTKYRALLNAVCSDQRLRGGLQFAGANRTGRWSGRIFQPQNMARPTRKPEQVAEQVAAIKSGFGDLVLDDVMDACSNAVRGCIIAPPGKKICVADLSNIEGRSLAWLAGEEWKLQAFRDYDAGHGPDLYKAAYARSFNIKPSDVADHSQERQIGKVQELGLGYQGGVAAFLTFASVYKLDLEEMAKAVGATANRRDMKCAMDAYAWAAQQKRTHGLSPEAYAACDLLKAAWRRAHPNVVKLWNDVQMAARRVILVPTETVKVRSLTFGRYKNWLRITLPSGRMLCYPSPRADTDGKLSYMGTNQYTRRWERVFTYGGKLVENITQAFARDVLAYNMRKIEDCGYAIVLSIHDELLTETPDVGPTADEPGYSHEDLAALMSRVPPWAKGLPLAAAGFEADRYRKD